MKNKGLLRSAGLVSGNTMMSRVLGLVRDMVIAQVFGATAGVDAFLVAFKLPNFMRRLFAEGAFAQAFVPILSEYQVQQPKDVVRIFVNRITGSLSSVLIVMVIVGIILAPLFIFAFAPGFDHGGDRFQLASHMLRITFPYLFFISLTALSGAILNTYGHYGVPSFTPVFLNIIMIGAALWLSHYFTISIYALAWGVLAAGIVQLLFQVPFLLKEKLLPKPEWGFNDPGVRRVLKLMVPALFGVSVAQVSLLVDTVFASFLKVGSVSWLYYSDRLMNFPLGVFGVAIATVILPHLSRNHANESRDQYSETLDWALRSLLVVGVPSMIGLFLLSGPLLATLFHYGAFNDYDVYMSRESLMAFSGGVVAFMSVKVLASGFYARQNIRTPVKIAALAMLGNVVFNLILIFPLRHAGIALATSLAGCINAGLLLFFLLKRKIYHPQAGWKKYAGQLCLASLGMGSFLLLLTGPLSGWLSAAWYFRFGHLFGLVAGAAGVYFSILFFTGLRFRHFKIR